MYISSVTGTTFYLYPDIRYDYKQFSLAFKRVARIASSGTRMGMIYLVNVYRF
jgi:hypothetical protein